MILTLFEIHNGELIIPYLNIDDIIKLLFNKKLKNICIEYIKKYKNYTHKLLLNLHYDMNMYYSYINFYLNKFYHKYNIKRNFDDDDDIDIALYNINQMKHVIIKIKKIYNIDENNTKQSYDIFIMKNIEQNNYNFNIIFEPNLKLYFYKDWFNN